MTRAGWLLAGMLLAVPAGARAQSLSGRVLDGTNGGGVEGALVELLGPDSTRVRAVLSGPGGRYVLRAPRPGVYDVRAVRMGYATRLLSGVELLEPEARDFDLTLAVEPVELAPVVATGKGRCVVRPDGGAETALLWGEARKVLEVTALVHRDALLRFEIVRFTRDLDLGREVLRGETLLPAILSNPFRSVDPDSLLRYGFVRSDGGSTRYYGPDPEVILSDAFLSSHCFHVAVREEPSGRLVGLAFEPAPGGPAADIRGVLWLDGGSGELRSVEYGYVGLADPRYEEISRGRATFEQLTTGVWVVRRWVIRMPLIEERKRFLGLKTDWVLTGVREEGGELLEAYTPQGRLVARPGPHRLAGRVLDGDRGTPLPGAVVRLSGSLDVDTADAEGRFAFGYLSRGEHLVTFTHPLQDTLGVFPGVRPSVVPSADGGELILRTPTREEVLAETCPDQGPREPGGVLGGTVRDASGAPVGGAWVTAAPSSARPGDRGVRGRAGPDGEYRFCGVPTARLLEVRADLDPARGEARTVVVPERGFARVDLVLPVPPGDDPRPGEAPRPDSSIGTPGRPAPGIS